MIIHYCFISNHISGKAGLSAARVPQRRHMAAAQKFKSLFSASDMTVGTPWKSIARFAFPMLIGNFAQQLYNTVDAVVVGRSKWGYTALAAVGNALPVLNLLLALFVGIATGVGILVAQYFSAKGISYVSVIRC